MNIGLRSEIRMRHRRRRNKPNRQIKSFVPNFLTLSGMCCGISGIHMALLGNISAAVVAILMAAFFDGIDGRTARKLGVTSHFGAELDSLSDSATFGISPAVIVYVYALKTLGNLGWAISLLFIMCMALRLARFNTRSIEKSDPVWMDGFGTGVPAPAGAYLLLMPIMAHQGFGVAIPAWVYGVWAIVVSCMLVSRIPTYLPSHKENAAPYKHSMAVLFGSVAYIGVAYSFPWWTMMLTGVAYLVSIPFSASKAYGRRRQLLH
ncbi:MAG: CDP-diacylglycerol--serine O-phosphatidyltransferase [Holosporales bacterium]|jgi:CDP-diacylglycerol--serine O-phosphatidyltransferase|nr:CDP-diacylglycerol--serine O-phosphatidyltransferase [Holosporales bacterium]